MDILVWVARLRKIFKKKFLKLMLYVVFITHLYL